MGWAGQKEWWSGALPTQIHDKQGRLIHVRAYEDKDFEGLKEMYDTFEPKGLESGLPPPDDQVRLRWLHYMISDLCNILAIHKNQPVGHTALDLSCTPSCPEYLIFIRKGFRDCGIGTTLSTAMKAIAKQSGCEKVVVTVRAANTRAIRVFEKVGFVLRGGIDRDRDMELCLRPRRTTRPRACKK
jgi:RimJ/RimL family protein N-acetyltransferase